MAITNYIVEWDQGTATWTNLVTTASTSSSAATGLIGGTTFQFRITATNAYGSSSVSSVLSVVAA